MKPWRLLGRPDCHLCEAFEAELRQRFPQLVYDKACVDDDPAWRFDYGRHIPVLLDAGGAPVCRSFLDAAAVEARLRQLGSQTHPVY